MTRGMQEEKNTGPGLVKRFQEEGIPRLSFSSPGEHRFFLGLAPGDVEKAARILAAENARLITISALSTNRGYELLYHFHIPEGVLTLKTTVPKNLGEMRSIAPIIPAAELVEHEVQELLGLTFPGNPRKENFILPQDWPEDKKPLKKEDEDLIRMTFPLAGRGQWRLEQ